jgi:hypothetical protein
VKFVDKTICETITKHQGAVRPVNRNNDHPPKFMSISYIPRYFGKFKFFMRKYNVNVVGKGENSVLKNFYTHFKDSNRTDVQSRVVSQVTFNSCQVMYIGNTIQYVKKRMYDHQNGIAKGNPDYSALVKHSLENPLHNIDFDCVGH